MERRRGHVAPLERIALEEGHEQCSDDAIVVDEAPVVPCKPQKATEGLDGARERPLLDHLDLVTVHSHDALLDHVAEVVDAPLCKGTLGLLEGEFMLA